MSLLIQVSDKKVFGFTLTIFNSMFLLSLSKFQHVGGGGRGKQIVRFIFIVHYLFLM